MKSDVIMIDNRGNGYERKAIRKAADFAYRRIGALIG